MSTNVNKITIIIRASEDGYRILIHNNGLLDGYLSKSGKITIGEENSKTRRESIRVLRRYYTILHKTKNRYPSGEAYNCIKK